MSEEWYKVCDILKTFQDTEICLQNAILPENFHKVRICEL